MIKTYKFIPEPKPFVLIALLIFLFAGNFSFAETSQDILIDDPIGRRIVDIATNQRYEEAFLILDSLINIYPANPYGYMLRATTLSARTIDFEDDQDLDDILAACQNVEKLAPVFFNNPDSSAQCQLYLGMATLYRSLVLLRQDQLLAMVRKLLQASENLKLAYKLDPTLWDVHYGLGMYQYQMSKHAGILRSIGLIADTREEGIEHIKIALEKGILTVNAARNSLAWIEMERENYDESIRISRENLTVFPGIRAFLWCLGKSLIYAEQWEESIPVFEQLLASVRSEEKNNFYNEIECLHKLTTANFELERWQDVVKYSDQVMSLSPSDKVKDKKSKDLSRIMKMRKRAASRIEADSNEK